MSMSDTTSDMLTRVRNAQSSKLISVSVITSKLNVSILSVLAEEGYIIGFNSNQSTNLTDVKLKYSRSGRAAIFEIHKVSKPGKRVYSAIRKLKNYYNNMGVYILSTSKGVMSDKNARSLNVGGEVVCKVF
ncbi:30S ribosomal protein S8 [Rickettsia endosymbiont of Cardiosporidium cionae]|uniref:30S ribosomal protein S8 n=1 Tax=Rickettsia endosymbiont of Cardiosporidium cionae TaxID=2777155 RepID=UPI0018941FA6|nr:30S ribosomal protein S8 [Rickettsia endosymbiont of Cardiosporidium cionae]KAF8818188.1 30S ribosomal protein S8 [Rickettsia endosymbiont of Cardiosporidium cionae]